MPNANEIGKGQAIKFNGDICMVLETQHRTPGNLRAFVQATLRSMRTGKSFVQRFNSNESLEVVPMSRKKYEFSYKDNTGYHFIDPVTYDDITFQEDFVAMNLLPFYGEDKVLWASDYPHPDSIWPNSHATVERQMKHLSPETRRALTRDNAAKLYGLDKYAARQAAE